MQVLIKLSLAKAIKTRKSVQLVRDGYLRLIDMTDNSQEGPGRVTCAVQMSLQL